MELNVDSLHIETAPIAVSRRKVKAGLKGMKQDERKKLTMALLGLIGGGTTIGAAVILWAIFSGKATPPKSGESKDSTVVAQAADSGGKKADKVPVQNKPLAEKGKETVSWKNKPSIDTVDAGNVEVAVLKPITLGPPPKGAKTGENEVLVVRVKLYLRKGEKEPIELTNWTDDALKKQVSLMDDQNANCELLDQVVLTAPEGSDGKTITKDWLIVQLVFQAPPPRA